MDVYQEIVNLLGLNSTPDTLEDLEQELLDELSDLNQTYRSLNIEMKETEDYLEDLRKRVSGHNQKAIEMIKSGKEQRARRELEQKEKALRKIEQEQEALTKLRRNIDRIESKRSDLEDKLRDIRNRKNRRRR